MEASCALRLPGQAHSAAIISRSIAGWNWLVKASRLLRPSSPIWLSRPGGCGAVPDSCFSFRRTASRRGPQSPRRQRRRAHRASSCCRHSTSRRRNRSACRKTLAANLAEADDLITRSEAAGRVIQPGHLERFNPAVLAVAQRLTQHMFFWGASPRRLHSALAHDVDVVLDLMIHDLDIVLTFAASPVCVKFAPSACPSFRPKLTLPMSGSSF